MPARRVQPARAGKRKVKEDSTIRLPDELLTEIFLILRDWSVEYNNTRAKRSIKRKDWIAVSYVCRRWRSIAIGYPRLWTTLDLTTHSRDRLSAFLIRSKGLPLDVERRCPCSRPPRVAGLPCIICDDIMKEAIGHLSRIRSIQVKNFHISDFWASKDQEPLVLEEINLSLSGGDNFPIILQDPHLTEASPSLRRVKLEGCMFIMRTQLKLFRDLTHLTIIDHFNTPDHFQLAAVYYPAIDELRHIFEACPDLIELELSLVKRYKEGLWNTTDAGTQVDGLQCLSRLTDVKIHEIEIDAAEALFSSLEMPSLSTIEVGIRHTSKDEASNILSIMKTIGKDRLPDDLLIEFGGFMTNFISKRDKPQPNSISSFQLSLIHVDDNGHVYCTSFPDPEDVMRTVEELLRGSTWSSLTKLTLYPGCRAPAVRQLWIDLFNTVPNVSELIMESESGCKREKSLLKSSNCFLSALTPAKKAESELALPALRKFVIRFPDITDIEDTISKFLQKRKQLDHPLVSMEFDRCEADSGYRKWLTALKRHVNDVNWRKY